MEKAIQCLMLEFITTVRQLARLFHLNLQYKLTPSKQMEATRKLLLNGTKELPLRIIECFL